MYVGHVSRGMTKIYIYKKIEGVSCIPELYPVWGIENESIENQLNIKRILPFYRNAFFEVVATPYDADFILVPHIYNIIQKKTPTYLDDAVHFSLQEKKPLLLFAYGDDDSDIALKNTVIFRYAQYRHRKRQNEIIVPLYAPDGSLETSLFFLEKHTGAPTVGFCGFAQYPSLRSAVKAFVKNFLWEVAALIQRKPTIRARKGGIYFRKKILAILSVSPHVKNAFIVRNFFSSHKKTIRIDLDRVRQEFLDNITKNDFALAVRGDGNASMRFYEALSLGRIPVVVDTDEIFPLEDIINYHDFCLFIPLGDIHCADALIRKYYNEMSPEDFLRKQKLAREIFEKYVRVDKFYELIFSRPEEILKRVKL